MMFSDKFQERFEKIAAWGVWLIIATGILLRLVLWFQNRNLIIDEANIVRNLSERGFGGLLLPLKYEQYAPPIFLWIEKFFSMLFGYGEKAMRLYPLLAGIASLFVFRSILRRLMPNRSLWLPMALMALTWLLAKYSVELKQYMPDAFIALLLVLCAMEKDLFLTSKTRFAIFWILAGSLAIWASMPSVFTLAAVGFYYSWQCIRGKRWNYLGILALVGIVWVAQFGAYYLVILKPQIESSYLQNYHADYFLYATPANTEQWQHDWMRIKEIINNTGGYNDISMWLTILLLLTGSIAMIRKRFSLFLLIATPVLLTIAAAMLKQFSLIDRVILFMLPLLLIILGYGFDQLWKLRFMPVQVAGILVGLFMIYNCHSLRFFRERLTFHEITGGLDYVRDHHADGNHVFIHDASVPTYIYYTELHPDRERYASLLGAHRMTWDSDYTEVTKQVRDTVYFIYTGGFPDGERERRKAQIEKNLKQVDYFEKYICFVFVYAPKPEATTMEPAKI